MDEKNRGDTRDDTRDDADNMAGMPAPNPPAGGPSADPGSPDPADLVPGLGGTSATRPESTEDDG